MSPIDAYPTPRETKRQFNVFDLIQRLVDPGTQEQSALAIVVICLGVGLTSAFYVFYACGLILGISLFAAGVTTTGLVACGAPAAPHGGACAAGRAANGDTRIGTGLGVATTAIQALHVGRVVCPVR